MAEYGYIRVSSKDQNEARQVAALNALGITSRNMYIEKQSGKNFDRPIYQKMLHRLRKGDTLFLHSIDRLGRDYEEIKEQWRIITKERGIDIVVLDMPLLDTRKKDLDVTGVLIADLVLQLLCYVAHKEREFNKKRQAEGIEIAQAKGVKFGRKPMKRPKQFREIKKAWANNEISAREAGRRLRVSYMTFLKWARM